jgi:single-stranded-DNA-specific exonuclease
VVALDQNNRVLVQQGLRRIRAGQCVPGILAILEIASKKNQPIVAGDLGFIVAPRLNAAGRLDDMSLGIECLLSDDMKTAREKAMLLNQLNDERKVIEQGMHEQALHALKKVDPGKKAKLCGVCLFDEEWHQGVIGILASRIKERMHRPVIVFAVANDFELKGSARSISGVHIRDVLAEIAVSYPSLITKFGGHAMAAGLTIPRAFFSDFASRFDEVVKSKLKESDLDNILWTDGELSREDLSLSFADILREKGPWGQAFPEPVFEGVFQILEQRLVGGHHLKMTLSLENQLIEAIAFNVDANIWPNYRCEYVKIAYRLDINEYRGKRRVQLIAEHLDVF